MKRKEKRKNKRFRRLIGFLTNLLLLVTIGLFAVGYLGYYVRQEGYSMDATITPGSGVWINRLWYALKEPQRYEIAAYQIGDKVQLKRIVGLPGEQVLIREGILYINGLPLYEAEKYVGRIEIAGRASEPVTLGEDEYFVLGDNPDRSEDSRFADTGNISRSRLIGRAWLTIGSVTDIRLIWETPRLEPSALLDDREQETGKSGQE